MGRSPVRRTAHTSPGCCRVKPRFAPCGSARTLGRIQERTLPAIVSRLRSKGRMSAFGFERRLLPPGLRHRKRRNARTALQFPPCYGGLERRCRCDPSCSSLPGWGLGRQRRFGRERIRNCVAVGLQHRRTFRPVSRQTSWWRSLAYRNGRLGFLLGARILAPLPSDPLHRPKRHT